MFTVSGGFGLGCVVLGFRLSINCNQKEIQTVSLEFSGLLEGGDVTVC